jgi:hypothetical protein
LKRSSGFDLGRQPLDDTRGNMSEVAPRSGTVFGGG